MSNKHNDIDDLLTELQETKNLGKLVAQSPASSTAITKSTEDITDDNVNEFILRKSADLIEQGMGLLSVLKLDVMAGGQSEEVEAYSKLVAAITTSIDTMNKINIQNKKAQTATALKKMDIESKTNQIELGARNVTNNIVIASREEIMQNLVNKATQDVDAELVEYHAKD